MSKKAIVIGSGFSGLSAASFMAKAGWQVHVLEKHSTPGGRARQLNEAGFKFDMGPSWYWMPDVFERYFASFGKKTTDYYKLKRLDPSYRVIWPEGYSDIPAEYNEIRNLFESWEKGAAINLDKFLKEAVFKYKIGMQSLVYKPGLSAFEFANMKMISGILRMDVFTSMKKHVAKYFKHPRIKQLMEFPVLFLGALPENTPALYSLMNYADMKGGTWYPEGGMYSVVEAMYKLALEQGVHFHFNEEVISINPENKFIKKIITKNNSFSADVIIASADYNFIEQKLLPAQYRTYSNTYWIKERWHLPVFFITLA